MTVDIEKIDTHEGQTVKALLDSGATGMFMSKSLAQKRGYRLIKLDQPLQVRNVDGTRNSGVSGPMGQSWIPLRGYEVKTRRTRQSSLYKLPSYLYNYKWLC